MFNKNQKVKDSFEFLELQRRVSSLELELEKLKTHINSLRGLINRKRALLDPDQETEDIKKDPGVDGLDVLRS